MQRDDDSIRLLRSTSIRTESYVASKEDYTQGTHLLYVYGHIYYAFYWYKREVSLRSSSFPNRHMMCRERMLQRERTTSSKELPRSSPFPQESIVDYRARVLSSPDSRKGWSSSWSRRRAWGGGRRGCWGGHRRRRW